MYLVQRVIFLPGRVYRGAGLYRTAWHYHPYGQPLATYFANPDPVRKSTRGPRRGWRPYQGTNQGTVFANVCILISFLFACCSHCPGPLCRWRLCEIALPLFGIFDFGNRHWPAHGSSGAVSWCYSALLTSDSQARLADLPVLRCSARFRFDHRVDANSNASAIYARPF